MAYSAATQSNSFRYFRWKSSRLRSPEQMYQYKARIEPKDRSSRLEYVSDLLTVTSTYSGKVQAPPHASTSANKIRTSMLARPGRKHSTTSGAIELSVNAQAVPITTKPIQRTRSAPSLIVATGQYKKSVVEKPFPYASPRSVVGMQPAFRRRLAELAHMEQQTVMGEEARKRTLAFAVSGSSSRRLAVKTQQAKTSATSPTRRTLSAGTRPIKKQDHAQSNTKDPIPAIAHSVSCIEINSTQTAIEGTCLSPPLEAVHEIPPQTSSSVSSLLPKSCVVLEEFITDTAVDSTSTSSFSQDSTDTSNMSDTSGSAVNMSTSSSGELIKENRCSYPEQIEENDSGVQLSTSESTNVLDHCLDSKNTVPLEISPAQQQTCEPSTELPLVNSSTSLPVVVTDSLVEEPDKKGSKARHTKTKKSKRPSSSTKRAKSTSHLITKTSHRKVSFSKHTEKTSS